MFLVLREAKNTVLKKRMNKEAVNWQSEQGKGGGSKNYLHMKCTQDRTRVKELVAAIQNTLARGRC